jgi:hypothetical protein
MIKACAGMRARLEDSAKGWCYLATAQHSDRVDLQVYRDAWHSELLSTEDNVHIRSFSPSTVESALMTKVASPRSIRNIGAVRNSVRTRTVWLHSMLQSTPYSSEKRRKRPKTSQWPCWQLAGPAPCEVRVHSEARHSRVRLQALLDI